MPATEVDDTALFEGKLHAALAAYLPQQLRHVAVAVGVIGQIVKLHVCGFLHA